MIGHSTGGMLAIRYALMYPQETQQLVLVNPIGLEDWKAKGVPSLSVDQWYERELKTTADGIRRYEQSTYYAGHWRADYEPWVQMLAGMYRGPGKQIVAWNSALLYDMIYTQPVVYELGELQMPTLLMIGQKDTTAIGKDAAPPEVRAQIGHYPELGRSRPRRRFRMPRSSSSRTWGTRRRCRTRRRFIRRCLTGRRRCRRIREGSNGLLFCYRTSTLFAARRKCLELFCRSSQIAREATCGQAVVCQVQPFVRGLITSALKWTSVIYRRMIRRLYT